MADGRRDEGRRDGGRRDGGRRDGGRYRTELFKLMADITLICLNSNMFR